MLADTLSKFPDNISILESLSYPELALQVTPEDIDILFNKFADSNAESSSLCRFVTRIIVSIYL